MNYEILECYIQGYGDRIFDQQILSIQTGFWAAYYNNSKHPKSVDHHAKNMIKSREKAEKDNGSAGNVEKPGVDVEAFKATEEQFLKRLQSR